jgi:hypothetical protein
MSIAEYLSKFGLGVNSQGILSAAKGGTGNTSGAGSTTPTISTISYGTGNLSDDTATDPAGGATITLTGTNFVTGAQVLLNSTPVSVVSVVNSTTITFTAPAKTAGSYIIYVINPNGSTALAVPGLQYSALPVWTTAAGSLGTALKTTSVNIPLAATGDATVSYTLASGTLPSGITVNSTTGALSGTAPEVASNTTYTFTVRATDGQGQDTDRQFNLTILAANPPPVEMLIVAGGGSGGATGGVRMAGGGAGGLLYYGTNTAPKTPNGGLYQTATGTTYTVTVGAGASSGNGNNSVFAISGTAVYTAIGGGRGGAGNIGEGVAGGSGGGGAYSSGAAGTAGQGNNGGSGSTNGQAGGHGGGGGAGGAGGNNVISGTGSSSITSPGAGGSGLGYDITGTTVGYAGGGGGMGVNAGFSGYPGAGGGYGGGGPAIGGAGGVNTGGGGGGGGDANSGPTPGPGGSGIVVIRYPNTYLTAASTTGSPTYTNTGGNHIYKFTSSGSITF